MLTNKPAKGFTLFGAGDTSGNVTATITVNGEETEYKTNENGKVTLNMKDAGSFVISAKSSSQTLVPPAVKLTVSDSKAPVTGDNTVVYLISLMAVIPAAVLVIKKKKSYEI